MEPPRTAADWIARLSVIPHPEGGWYRETYRAMESATISRLHRIEAAGPHRGPERSPSGRPAWYGAEVAPGGAWMLTGEALRQ